MNIVIRVEVLGRELQGRLLLALAAAERGHTAVILDKVTAIGLSRTRIDALPAGYFHDNSPGQEGGKTILHETLHARGWQITGQDEEHGLASGDFDGFLASMSDRFPLRAMSNKSAMFAFGAFDAEGIRASCPEHADRVLVTGSPRVDFWRRDFGPFYDHHPYPLRPDRPRFVLSVMSLSPFFSAGPQMSFTGADSSEVVLLARAGACSTDAASVQDHRRIVRIKLAIEALARRHPDVLFIQRPHPAEQHGAWEAVFADAPENVRVIRDNAVSPWVRNAECVIFEASTIGFEAVMAGIPTVRFATDTEDPTPGSNRMGHLATSATELSEVVGGILSGAEPPMPAERRDAMLATLSERFHATDGRLAADRIVDAWESLATAMVSGAAPLQPSDLVPPRTLGSVARRTASTVMLRTGLAPRAMREQARRDRELRELKFPGFDLAEVERIHRALVESLGRFRDVRITQVRPHVLHLTAG